MQKKCELKAQELAKKEEQELAKKEQLKMAHLKLENIKRQYDSVNQEHPVSPKNYNQIRQIVKGLEKEIEKLEGELKAIKASKQKQDNSKKLQRPSIVKRMDISLCKKHSMIQETHEKAEAVKLNRKLLEKKQELAKQEEELRKKLREQIEFARKEELRQTLLPKEQEFAKKEELKKKDELQKQLLLKDQELAKKEEELGQRKLDAENLQKEFLLKGQELAREKEQDEKERQKELRQRKLEIGSEMQKKCELKAQELAKKEEQELAKKEQLKMAHLKLENIKRQYDSVNQEHPVSPKNYNQIRQIVKGLEKEIEKLEGELKAIKASKQKQDNSKKLQRPSIVKRMDISLCKKHSMIQETHEKAEAVKLNRKLLEKKQELAKQEEELKEKIREQIEFA